MHHCLKVLHPSAVMEPERISKTFFNSLSNSAWTALQNIKRPAKGCIPNHYAQNVTWTSADYTELEVHTGAKKMDRVTVSHTIIRTTYMTLLASIRERLRLMDIKVITYEDFNMLRESSSSTHPGEGMATFNNVIGHTEEFIQGRSREFRLQFLKDASHVYQMVIAAVHLCGGPSPRGTEEAVTRLLNSNSERMRNVQLMAHTIGIQNGYMKQRNYVEVGSIQSIVVKYLPIPFAVILASVILRVKPVEAEFSFAESGANKLECSSFLVTDYGVPVQPGQMSDKMSGSMKEAGFSILGADLRHALEAFSHKFRRNGTGWIESFARGANHTLGTSARYGRDQNSFVGIPADLCEENCDACNMWNVKVLHSPSVVHDECLQEIYQQMNSLDLLSAKDISFWEERRSVHKLPSCDRSPDCVKTVSAKTNECGRQQLPAQSSEDKESNIQDHTPSPPTFWEERRSKLPLGDRSPECVKTVSDKSHECGGHELPDQLSDKKESNSQYRTPSPPTQKAKQVRSDEEINQRRLRAKQIVKTKLRESLSPMQDQALQFLENTHTSAFVVMPTGSGKTHLIWSHKKDDECSVIFAPYRLLVLQLKTLCEEKGLTVTWPLDSFEGSSDAMLCNVQFALLPYEAAPVAHTFLKGLHRKGRLGPVWIDEVRDC